MIVCNRWRISLWMCLGAFFFSCHCLSEETELNVGIIIEGKQPSKEQAFRKGIEAANKRLQEFESSNTLTKIKLVPIIKMIDPSDAFAASKATCELVANQVVGIFGPESNIASAESLRISRRHEIPYMMVKWSFDQPLENYAINLHPYYDSVGRALVNFINVAEEWKHFGLIYAYDDSLVKFESLLSNFKGDVVLRRWDSNDLSHKYIIKYFMKTYSQFTFIVDIPQSEIASFLDLITEYNMTNQYYSYIFTDWDTQFLNPKTFSVDSGGNFSALSLMNVVGLHYSISQHSSEGRSIFDRATVGISNEETQPLNTRDSLTYYFLVCDTLHLFAFGLSKMNSALPEGMQPPVGLTCQGRVNWTLGPQLVDSIKSTKPDDIRGFTGHFEFDAHGRRKNVNLTIVELQREGYKEFGYWNENDKLVVTKTFSTTKAEIQKELKGQTLRVITAEDKPFMMYKGPPPVDNVYSNNPKDWHGFCIDLLNECAAALQFNYTVHLPDDRTYGSATIVNGVEMWDGVIGELQRRKADLAVASLTINYERERVIDFTTPFMNLGVSIIFKKPVDKQPDLFSFLRPLSPTVWGYVLIAYVGVSMALFFVARFSPYEWNNPHPCNANSELLENNFNMLNSLWFTIGSLVQQGSDILPRATSTRIIAGFWWFFTLIIMSSYTANLAAFLTVERMKAPIEDVNDLAKQTRIKYGTREGGSSAAFFEKSNISVYQRMWQFMSTHKNVMMNNTEEAIARVRRGGYAYILESTMNEYYTQRDCDLMQVGGNLDSKGYGVGFPQGSKYRDSFSEVILVMQTSQKLEEMRRYWWRNYSIETPCGDQGGKKADASSLGVEQVGGCFVMVLIGLGSSLLISLSEFLYKAFQRSKVTKRPMREEVAREFRFSMARSNTRDFAAESALSLPPPPSKCMLSSKDCRLAAMAYAPCLPSVMRPPEKADTVAAHSHAPDRRPSTLNAVRMHRRYSSNRRSRSSTSGNEHSQLQAIPPREEVVSLETNLGGPSDSTRPLLTQVSSNEIGHETGMSTVGWRYAQGQIGRTPYPTMAGTTTAPPLLPSSQSVPKIAQSQQMPSMLSRTPVREFHEGQQSKDMRSEFSGLNSASNFPGSQCDVRLKKFTC